MKLALAATALFALLLSPAKTDELKILPDSAPNSSRFGTAVASSGDFIVVGAPNDTGAVIDSGAVYVYSITNPGEATKIFSANGAAADGFGRAVAIDRDVIVIGAPTRNVPSFRAGGAYVYRFNGSEWALEAALTSPNLRYWSFGHSVNVHGDAILVTSPHNYDGALNNTGAGFFFRRVNGAWQPDGAVITNDQTTAGDGFGRSSSLESQVAVIGGNARSFVYKHDGIRWTRIATLSAPGESVSLSGEWLALGSPFDSAQGPNSGAVHLYQRVNEVWTQRARLLPTGAVRSARFGASLRLLGHRLAVGSPTKTARETNERPELVEAGAAMLFEYRNGNWHLNSEYVGRDTASYDFLGASVALARDLLIAGAPGHDRGGADVGAVYIFGPRRTLGDANGDRCVDDIDLAVVLDAFGMSGTDLREDLNGDGVVDDRDLAEVLANYGLGC